MPFFYSISNIRNKEWRSNVSRFTTNFSTTSLTYVDITDAAITISGLTASRTYTIKAICFLPRLQRATAGDCYAKLIIGSTDVCEARGGASADGIGVALSGLLKNQTGITSITAKAQLKTIVDGTASTNTDSATATIMLEIHEE